MLSCNTSPTPHARRAVSADGEKLIASSTLKINGPVGGHPINDHKHPWRDGGRERSETPSERLLALRTQGADPAHLYRTNRFHCAPRTAGPATLRGHVGRSTLESFTCTHPRHGASRAGKNKHHDGNRNDEQHGNELARSAAPVLHAFEAPPRADC